MTSQLTPTALRTGHVQPVHIHVDDLDMQGIVGNARYPLIVERAVTAYSMERGWHFDPARSRFSDTLQVVREFRIEYHAPIADVGPVGVHLWIERLGRSSYTYGFRILSEDGTVTHADGHRVQVRLDPGTLRPTPLSDEAVTAARQLMMPQA